MNRTTMKRRMMKITKKKKKKKKKKKRKRVKKVKGVKRVSRLKSLYTEDQHNKLPKPSKHVLIKLVIKTF